VWKEIFKSGCCELVEIIRFVVAYVFSCWTIECCCSCCCRCRCCCCWCCCCHWWQRSDAWIVCCCIRPRIPSCVTTPVRWTTLLSSDAARTTTIVTAISNPFCTKPQQVIHWTPLSLVHTNLFYYMYFSRDSYKFTLGLFPIQMH